MCGRRTAKTHLRCEIPGSPAQCGSDDSSPPAGSASRRHGPGQRANRTLRGRPRLPGWRHLAAYLSPRPGGSATHIDACMAAETGRANAVLVVARTRKQSTRPDCSSKVQQPLRPCASWPYRFIWQMVSGSRRLTMSCPDFASRGRVVCRTATYRLPAGVAPQTVGLLSRIARWSTALVEEVGEGLLLGI